MKGYVMNEVKLLTILLAILIFVLIVIGITAIALSYERLYRRKKSLTDTMETKLKVMDFVPEKGDTVFLSVGASDSVTRYVSENIEQVFGLKKDVMEADVYAIKRLVAYDDVNDFEKEFENWDKQGSYEKEFEFVNDKTGDGRVGKAKISYDKKNGTYIVLLRDVTSEAADKRRIQKELDGMKNMNAYRNEFLTSLSHAVRTPINSVIGNLQLAKANASDAGLVGKYAENAAGQTEFLLSLLDVMFDISQIETGGIELESKRFDILSVAEKIRRTFTDSVEESGKTFTVNASNFNVRYLMGDPLRLQQILISFITRAQENDPECTNISLEMRQMNTATDKVNIMFRVKDNGRALSKSEINSILTPMEGEMTGGFALALSEQLIRMMGGQVTAEAENGENNFTIFLTFPLSDEVQDMSAPVEQEAAVNENFTYEGCRILLAEDNDMNAEIAKDLLEMQGAMVDIAQNGVIALDKFKANPTGYDVILMDIQMPEMEGWEATRRIRALGTNEAKTIPIFALSANVFAEDKRNSIEAGMNGHVTKPIDFEELGKELAKYL